MESRAIRKKLGTLLQQRVTAARPHDRLEVQIFLHSGSPAFKAADADSVEAQTRGSAISQAQEAARTSQQSFLADVGAAGEEQSAALASPPFRLLWTHWINNSVGAEVSPDTLRTILGRPDVERVDMIAHANIEDLFHGPAGSTSPAGAPVTTTASKIAWQVRYVNAPLLWNLGLRGSRALVAVVDSGISFNHPDLTNRRWNGGPDFPLHGFNFENSSQAPEDEKGHGTSCAGLISGDGSSGIITGIAPEATLMALRVGGSEDHFVSAFEFAAEHEADVISLSMGWGADRNPSYTAWRRACETLLTSGVVHVCSSGNEGDLTQGVFKVPHNIPAPAICPPPWLHPDQHPGGRASAIACGETDNSDRLIATSGRGPSAWDAQPYTDYPYQNEKQGLIKPDICAPGYGSKTCNPKFGNGPAASPYKSFGGTSAAAAIVAGCASLLVDAAKRSGKPVRPQRIQEALEETAVPIQGQTTKQNNLGSGRVDVFAAYGYGVEKGWWQ